MAFLWCLQMAKNRVWVTFGHVAIKNECIIIFLNYDKVIAEFQVLWPTKLHTWCLTQGIKNQIKTKENSREMTYVVIKLRIFEKIFLLISYKHLYNRKQKHYSISRIFLHIFQFPQNIIQTPKFSWILISCTFLLPLMHQMYRMSSQVLT